MFSKVTVCCSPAVPSGNAGEMVLQVAVLVAVRMLMLAAAHVFCCLCRCGVCAFHEGSQVCMHGDVALAWQRRACMEAACLHHRHANAGVLCGAGCQSATGTAAAHPSLHTHTGVVHHQSACVLCCVTRLFLLSAYHKITNAAVSACHFKRSFSNVRFQRLADHQLGYPTRKIGIMYPSCSLQNGVQSCMQTLWCVWLCARRVKCGGLHP